MRLLTLKTVLVATDLYDGSRAALTTARELADAAGAAVHVVHVSDKANAIEAVTATLREARLPPERVSVHVVQGDPAPAINKLAHRIDSDAILVGPHRRRNGVNGKRFLGSTALALVTEANVPCLVAGVSLQLPLHRVLAGVDMRDSSRGTLMVALSWASALRAHDRGGPTSTVLTALHIEPSMDPGDGRNGALEELLGDIRKDAGTWAGAAIESDIVGNRDPGDGIIDYARLHHAEMIVLGTSGLRVDNGGRLGSVAAEVTQKLDTPVLLVPPAVWMTYTN